MPQHPARHAEAYWVLGCSFWSFDTDMHHCWVQLELILTAATLCIAIVGVISGLFGMNLHNTHEDSYTTFVLVSSFPSAYCSWPVKDAIQGFMVLI